MNLDNLSKAKILIVGDIMLDQYWLGDSARISPEAPVPIVNIREMSNRLGGASNVAMNVSALGASVTLIGIAGNDENADKLEALLQGTNIHSKIIRKDNFKTLTKLRAVSRNQQLLRLDFENENYITDTADVVSTFSNLINDYDVAIISDYGKGTVNQVEEIIKIASKNNKKVVIDPKGDDYKKYYNASVITPNFSEFQQIVGPCEDEAEIESKATELCNGLSLDALLITRSEKGMSLFIRGKPPFHIPTEAKEVYDVTGAGDTVVALLASALAADFSLEDAVKAANLGAGVSVSKFGTVSVTIDELKTSLYMRTSLGKSITDLNELKQKVLIAKQNNEKIVFTNGCFDLLHHGHVACLRDAKSQGDRLVVAINDDDSVKRLKGESRPVCGIHNRVAVLEELNCIDWIIPFSEDTPLELIKALQPDIFVKGGDYKKEELAEYSLVTSYGGEVVISPYIKGCSTTTIIESILNSE